MTRTQELVGIHNDSAHEELVEQYHVNNTYNKKTIGTHNNLPGHQKAYFKAQVIERMIPNTKFYRLEWESFWIKKLDTINPRGLNVHN